MTGSRPQSEQLAEVLEPWLEAIDAELAERDVALSQRPFDALFRLLRLGAIELKFGDDPVDLSNLTDHLAEGWFRALYVAVEHWYTATFGAAAMRPKGVPPLDGVVLLRDAPLHLAVPNHRSKVEIEGKQTWMYFEDGLGPGEDALRWVKGAPDLSTSHPERHATLAEEARQVAEALRFIHFRRLGVSGDKDPAAHGLVNGVSIYLQHAARRIASAKPEERGPAWFDLQMAMESALKLVLQRGKSAYPHTHDLDKLLKAATPHGVVFDPTRLKTWPTFTTISDNRYVQGDPGDISQLYAAYRLTLDLVVAAMSTVKPAINAGAGFLLQYPPWLSDDDHGAADPNDPGPVSIADADPVESAES